MSRTLTRLFAESVERFPDRVLLWERKGPRYEGITYAQMRDQAQRFAAGLMRLGLRRGTASPSSPRGAPSGCPASSVSSWRGR